MGPHLVPMRVNVMVPMMESRSELHSEEQLAILMDRHWVTPMEMSKDSKMVSLMVTRLVRQKVVMRDD